MLKLFLNSSVVSNIEKDDKSIITCFQVNKLYNYISCFCLGLLIGSSQGLIKKIKEGEKTIEKKVIAQEIFDFIVNYLRIKNLINKKFDELTNLEMVLEEMEGKTENFCPMKHL